MLRAEVKVDSQGWQAVTDHMGAKLAGDAGEPVVLTVLAAVVALGQLRKLGRTVKRELFPPKLPDQPDKPRKQ